MVHITQIAATIIVLYQIYTATNAGNIFCRGKEKCLDKVIDEKRTETTICDGTRSCQRATIMAECWNNKVCELSCLGTNSCQQAIFEMNDLRNVVCDGSGACQDAIMHISNPDFDFMIACTKPQACKGLNLDLTIEPGTTYIQDSDINLFGCDEESACEGATFTIANYGAEQLFFEELNCGQTNSCKDMTLQLIGDIKMDECKCGVKNKGCMGVTVIVDSGNGARESSLQEVCSWVRE